ncbi:MAG: hypothetical protein Q9182_000526 [Xanthomendoza sp. 2 TL-2023]
MGDKSTSVQEEYIHPRSYRDSARLHMQHWIWNNLLGYCLHPSVPKDQANIKVADVACGNAVWLLDLASNCPSSWSLTGFDVSTAQFPHAAYLPSNVSLKRFDAFEPVTPELVEAFDVIHLRALCVVVKGGDPSVLIENVAKMLKPGGYIQWDDFDPDTFIAYSPSGSISKTSSDEIIKTWANSAKQLNLNFGYGEPSLLEEAQCCTSNLLDRWLSTLPSLLEKVGIFTLQKHRFSSPSSKLRKAATDNWMMALEETMFVILNRGGEEGEKERFRKLLAETVEDTKAGVGMWIDFLSVMGRKGGL